MNLTATEVARKRWAGRKLILDCSIRGISMAQGTVITTISSSHIVDLKAASKDLIECTKAKSSASYIMTRFRLKFSKARWRNAPLLDWLCTVCGCRAVDLKIGPCSANSNDQNSLFRVDPSNDGGFHPRKTEETQ